MSISLVTTNIICRQNICQTTKLNAMKANIAKLILLDDTHARFYSHIRSLLYSFNGNMREMLLKKEEIEEKHGEHHVKLCRRQREKKGDSAHERAKKEGDREKCKKKMNSVIVYKNIIKIQSKHLRMNCTLCVYFICAYCLRGSQILLFVHISSGDY